MKLKEFLVYNIQQLIEEEEYAATKRDVKQMEMTASKIVKTMEKLNSQFKRLITSILKIPYCMIRIRNGNH